MRSHERAILRIAAKLYAQEEEPATYEAIRSYYLEKQANLEMLDEILTCP